MKNEKNYAIKTFDEYISEKIEILNEGAMTAPKMVKIFKDVDNWGSEMKDQVYVKSKNLIFVDSWHYGEDRAMKALKKEWSKGGAYYDFFLEEYGVKCKIVDSFTEIQATGRHKKLTDNGIVGVEITMSGGSDKLIQEKNNDFFNRDINEKYFTYDDYAKSKWGTPEEIKKDVEVTVKNKLPGDFEIDSIEDQSTDKGIKFEVKLNTKDTLILYKNKKERFQYEWYINKKKIDSREITSYLVEKMTPLERYIRAMRMEDWNSNYSDDYSVWKNPKGADENFTELYSQLSSSDKKEAFKVYTKDGPKTKEKPDFKTFTGI